MPHDFDHNEHLRPVQTRAHPRRTESAGIDTGVPIPPEPPPPNFLPPFCKPVCPAGPMADRTPRS